MTDYGIIEPCLAGHPRLLGLGVGAGQYWGELSAGRAPVGGEVEREDRGVSEHLETGDKWSLGKHDDMRLTMGLGQSYTAVSSHHSNV